MKLRRKLDSQTRVGQKLKVWIYPCSHVKVWKFADNSVFISYFRGIFYYRKTEDLLDPLNLRKNFSRETHFHCPGIL